MRILLLQFWHRTTTSPLGLVVKAAKEIDWHRRVRSAYIFNLEILSSLYSLSFYNPKSYPLFCRPLPKIVVTMSTVQAGGDPSVAPGLRQEIPTPRIL
jgi:hypothetical protein